MSVPFAASKAGPIAGYGGISAPGFWTRAAKAVPALPSKASASAIRGRISCGPPEAPHSSKWASGFPERTKPPTIESLSNVPP